MGNCTMANDELNGRVVYSPRGRNAEDDLAECMVAAADIFLIGDQLIWIDGGRYIPVVRQAVLEICRRFIVTKHPVNRGTEAKPDWVVERRPVVPNELTIRNLIRESLPKRAPVVPLETAMPREEPAAMLPDNHPEAVAGRRGLARYAETGTPQEAEAGRRAAAKFA
jgi:hypothetical protein